MFGARTNALQRRAQKVMPLGVNSNFRFWGDNITPYVEKAKGAYLWDVDGKKYIDYRLAFGPIILGHSFDEVDQKVIEEIQRGILFAMTGELEVAVVETVDHLAGVGLVARGHHELHGAHADVEGAGSHLDLAAQVRVRGFHTGIDYGDNDIAASGGDRPGRWSGNRGGY